jgi:fatty-acyl-CoA synthase
MNLPLTPIRFLYRAVDLYPGKVGIVSGDRRLTYLEFGQRCEKLATALKAYGIRPGDRVAFLSFNNHQLLEAYYGVPMAEAIVMPLNVRLTPSELTGILNHSEARLLFFESDFAPVVAALRESCPHVEKFVTMGDSHELADWSYEEVLERGMPERADWTRFDENSIAELFYTSGSTGTPKGVALAHRTLYLHAFSVLPIASHEDSDVELHTIPLFHANGWGRPQVCVMLGQKQVMVRRFEPSLVLRLIHEERATGMSLVPTMANALINAPDLSQFDVSSMKLIHLGGAAASPELVARMEKAFPQSRCVAGYGLTETSPVATDSRPKSTVPLTDEADTYFRRSMAGWPIPGCEVRVVDFEMNDVPRDMKTIGEVVIRGDNVMDGYYKEPEATRAAMTGAWLHTGDMAVWDEDNFVQIVDRKKDIIISGGENISSIEVEKAIYAHPAVFECAVVSAPDDRWGEIPVAIVVLKEGHNLSFEGLCEFLSGRLARFKMPRRVDFRAEPLPKTGTGKVVKRRLREEYWSDKERRVQG